MDLNIQDAGNVTVGDQSAPTSTAQSVVDLQNKPDSAAKPPVDPKIKKRNDEFRTRVDTCKLYRRKLIANWTISIDYRRGKPFVSQTDEDQIAVNLDWSLVKEKQAALFSQVPQVRVNHGEDLLPQTNPWALTFQKKLNDTLVDSGIESAMDECLPDCINAAGLGIISVSYESITEPVSVPTIDFNTLPPQIAMQAMQTGQINGQPIPMEQIDRPVDTRYVIQRISPSDFLWPINFVGSNFDNAPWVGRSGRITWAQAVQQFGLTPADKDLVLGEDRPQMDKLTHDVERDKVQADDMVGFDEVFYHEFQFDENARSFDTIHRLVFVNGKDDPVIDEPWKGQKVNDDQGTVIGAQKYPIRVLTLAYVTDETIPPSDSAIIRPQVNEINKARTQMIHQRERSIPVRWFDVNRVDPAIQQGLMRGSWQNMIPVQGDGSRTLGEVARASMPQENFAFDRIAKEDMGRSMGMPTATIGATSNPETTQTDNPGVSLNTRLIRERARVSSFVVGIAEVLGGLMCLYEDSALFGKGFDPTISRTLNYSILADSTVLLDATQRLQRLNNFVNTYAKSGYVNLAPVLQEIATLSGLDPTIVIQPPNPKPPVEPNISLRLTGVEDLLNPLTLAFLMKSGQAPAADLIEQAKALIQQAVVPPANMSLQPGAPAPGGAPMLPNGQAPVGATPPPPAPLPGDANPQLSSLPKITERSQPGGNQ